MNSTDDSAACITLNPDQGSGVPAREHTSPSIVEAMHALYGIVGSGTARYTDSSGTPGTLEFQARMQRDLYIWTSVSEPRVRYVVRASTPVSRLCAAQADTQDTPARAIGTEAPVAAPTLVRWRA